MVTQPHTTLILACGALAKEILALKDILGLSDDVFDLQCLPANYHNFPDKIVPHLDRLIAERGARYDKILIGYGDCGTGGGLDRLIKKHSKAERLPGAHCYAFYAGLSEFDSLMEEELGTFFLTDYLAQHFQTLVIKGFGIDRYPELKETYFANYKRLVYMSQAPTNELISEAKAAADYLGLKFQHRVTGYGFLKEHIEKLKTSEATYV